MTTGDGPYRVTTSGTLATGLAVDTNYWIIAPTAGTFKYASSYANALAGTAVDLTAAGSGNTTLKRTANDVLVALHCQLGLAALVVAAVDHRRPVGGHLERRRRRVAHDLSLIHI